MSVAVKNEINMNSVKNIESDLNENLSNEILEMDNGSLNIEQAFLAEQQQQEQQERKQQFNGRSTFRATPQQSIPKSRTNNNASSPQFKSSSTSASVTPTTTTSTTTNTTTFANTGIQDMQPDNSQTKAFRFVNNSPNSMYKQKSRMKPTFKVGSQMVQGNGDHLGNNESVIIEQTFNNKDDGTQFATSNDKKYVFQLNVKRPPGRPRKYPLEKPKAKRPQGRPRKYPVEVTGSTINHHNTNSPSKVVKKTLKDSNDNRTVPVSVPIDTELISMKKSDEKVKHFDSQSDLENNPDFVQNETNFAIATASATQSTFSNSQGKP